MFNNTKGFSDLATYYKKNKIYPYQDEYKDIFTELNQNNKGPIILPTFDDLSSTMQEFAMHWIDIFVNGDSIGGCPITGEHSHYLNCCYIQRVNKNEFGRGTRGGGFPDFWDEDFKYFWSCDIGKWGINRKRLKTLNSYVELNLLETDENLAGGLDILYGKPRGVGASWKGAGYANYNLRLVPESKTFVVADKEEYLLKDGLYSKFYTLSSFINENCWWLRKSFVKESLSEMNFETGIRESIGGSKIVTGFGSSVIGIVVDGDKEKVRGKRGNFLFEEFGSFPEVDNAWNVLEASVNEYGVIYGQKRGFGTGGDTHGGMVALEKMVYKPKEYRILEFNNIYEEFKGSICLFTPAYRNITHKDEHGNSDEEAGKKWLADAEAKKNESNDITEVTAFKAEYCSKPGDMFKNAGVNILPVELATECLEFLERTNIDRVQCTHGTLTKGINKVFFTPTKALPYELFPVKPGEKNGCISIFKKPYTIAGKVPKGLYIVAVDGYTQDGLGGKSIGSVRVLEQPNKYTSYKGDMEVAWYDGRPEGFDGLGTFAQNVYLLAELYNAKISLENDQVGDIISYGKKNTDSHGRKLTMYLAEQFDLAFNEKIATKKSMDRAFGMNMTEPRFLQGMKYAQQWLIKPRGVNSEGKLLLNIHFIMSRGLLREIKDYNGENADRLSAFIIAMYHLRENEDNSQKEGRKAANYLKSLNLFS